MLFHTLLQHVTGGRTRARTGRKRPTLRCAVEGLEDRNLLSGSALGGAAAAYGQLPLAFEANQGQAAPSVDFVSHGSGYTLSLTSQAAVLDLNKGPGAGGDVLRLALVGADPAAQVAGLDPLITKSNYFTGSDPRAWITNVPTFGKVAYQNVYPGIGLVYYGNQGRLEYDFNVAPGADRSAIRLAISGARSPSLDAQGNLVLHTSGGDVVEQAPVLYQEVGGVRQAVSGRFVLEGNNQVGFQVGTYDPSRPLVIDPTISYSAYLGVTSSSAIAVDSSGNAYMTGYNSFTPGTIFVDKLDAAGTALVYSTSLVQGGDGGYGIAVDSAGDAYVMGLTTSSTFPTTPNAFAPSGSGVNGFLSVLNPAGSGLIYSTYLPGVVRSGAGIGGAIAVDGAGNAYITGSAGPAFPTTAGAFQTTDRNSNGAFNAATAFLVEINPNLSGAASLVYATFLGGSGGTDHNEYARGDYGTAVAVDGAGNAYVAGDTYSADFPTTAGAFQTRYGGTGDNFVAKFNTNQSGAASLVYATYLGGSGWEYSPDDITTFHAGGGNNYTFRPVAPGLAVDSAGDAYVAGWTTSSNFPTTAGAYQRSGTGANGVAFVTKLNPSGSGLVYSTLVATNSTSGPTAASAIAVDSSGNAYVAGVTYSKSFPLMNPTQRKYGGNGDAFVTTLNASGSALLFSTYLGGSTGEYATGIALDSASPPNAYVTGETGSADFPTTPGAYQTTMNYIFEGFVTEIDPPAEGGGPVSPSVVQQPASPLPAPADNSASRIGSLPLLLGAGEGQSMLRWQVSGMGPTAQPESAIPGAVILPDIGPHGAEDWLGLQPQRPREASGLAFDQALANGGMGLGEEGFFSVKIF
jgi:hypothetical protein